MVPVIKTPVYVSVRRDGREMGATSRNARITVTIVASVWTVCVIAAAVVGEERAVRWRSVLTNAVVKACVWRKEYASVILDLLDRTVVLRSVLITA